MPARATPCCRSMPTLAAVAMLALADLGTASTLPTPASRLEQHAGMLAAAPRADRAARYIETTLASFGYLVSRHDYDHRGRRMRTVEVALANPACRHGPGRIFIIGARDQGNGAAMLIELARLLRHVSPAPGTELHFVFFVNGAGQPAPGAGNFIAFAGPRGAAEPVRKALAAFRAAASFPVPGLVAPAYMEGVTLVGPLLVTDTASLRYPYSHTAQAQPDYASMAADVAGLSRLIESMAAPPSM
jgi:hypothetical protein